MHADPILLPVATTALVIVFLGLIFRTLKQPQIIVYIIVGCIIGPSGMALISDEGVVAHIGSLGVTILLFFVGMEVSPKQLTQRWKIATAGTLLAILISVGCTWLLGHYLYWPLARIVLLGFVISLSSTAVVLKLLQQWNELHTPVGQNVLVILLAQDLAIIPMLIILGLLGSSETESKTLLLQLVGGSLVLALVFWAIRKSPIQLPFAKLVRSDHEIQVFTALLICFGIALLTGLFSLSTALGAFVGGLIVALTDETDWVKQSLEPFHIVFVAIFFVSIGMLIELRFLKEHWIQILALVSGVLLINTFINAMTLRFLGIEWRSSLYAAVLLSQIGEFSFILASVGVQSGIIAEFTYQMTISVIAISLLVSPVWIGIFKLGLRKTV